MAQGMPPGMAPGLGTGGGPLATNMAKPGIAEMLKDPMVQKMLMQRAGIQHPQQAQMMQAPQRRPVQPMPQQGTSTNPMLTAQAQAMGQPSTGNPYLDQLLQKKRLSENLMLGGGA